MNICLFGGAFDPIHRGHLAVARAAVARFSLDRVLFVPSPAPPHKPAEALAPFADRYAMVALATSAVKKFIPSDIEFQRAREGRSALPSYSIDTVRNFRRGMSKSDSLFFLLGMDAFLGIATWRQPGDLLQESQFIVATRPGYSLRRWREALPPDLLPPGLRDQIRFIKGKHAASSAPQCEEGKTAPVIRLLDTVHDLNSATAIRRTVLNRGNLTRFVTPAVAAYIRKRGLYQAAQ